VTGQLAALSVLSILMCPPEPSGRQSGDLDKKWKQFGLRNIFIHARKVLLHAVNLRHETDGFTSPPKEVVFKNPSTSVGIEPANLGSSGEHTIKTVPFFCVCHVHPTRVSDLGPSSGGSVLLKLLKQAHV
jgi:hypothetical protein